jgi:hypothetical protein
VLVLRKNTSCGRKGEAGWLREVARKSIRKRKMPGRRGAENHSMGEARGVPEDKKERRNYDHGHRGHGEGVG